MEKLFGEYLIPVVLLVLLFIIIGIMTVFFVIRRRNDIAMYGNIKKERREEKKRIKAEEAAKKQELILKDTNTNQNTSFLYKITSLFKKYPLQSIISLVLIIAIPVTAFFVFSGQKEQKFDPRDYEYTSSELAKYQRILNEAGNPGWGLLEYLSYSTRYVEDEETGDTLLVVDGFLRNGYSKAIKIDELELTIKTADQKEVIAAAAFEDDYGEIPAKTSIKWRFNFTSDYIEDFSADLAKTYNILNYQITKVTK